MLCLKTSGTRRVLTSRVGSLLQQHPFSSVLGNADASQTPLMEVSVLLEGTLVREQKDMYNSLRTYNLPADQTILVLKTAIGDGNATRNSKPESLRVCEIVYDNGDHDPKGVIWRNDRDSTALVELTDERTIGECKGNEPVLTVVVHPKPSVLGRHLEQFEAFVSEHPAAERLWWGFLMLYPTYKATSFVHELWLNL